MRSLSYAEVDSLSDAVAEDILAATGGRAGAVIVSLPRSVDLVVALLGVLKAGCWYLPISLEEPPERIRAFVAAGEPILRFGAADPGHTAFADVPHLPVRGHVPPSRPLRDLPEVAPEHPVYLMFTSGSSGAPKGVLVGSGAVVNRILWQNRTHGLTPDDRILQKTPHSFDVSGWEFYCPLTVGACCVLLPEGDHRDPVRLREFIREREITACHFVPSMLAEFLRVATAEDLRSVRMVFASGEALPAPLAVSFHEVFTRAHLVNMYGPTEAAIEVSHWPVPRSLKAGDRVRIGRPISNAVLRVADRRGRPVAPGEAGELWIGGVPLALGYTGRPELTAEAFPTVDGSRWYRTGDLVRCVDGELEYLGRIDQQVKVRGVRIEAGEVESALARHPGVGQAIVAAIATDAGPGRELLAALTPADAGAPPVADAELREFLRARLPPAYTPTAFHWPDSLPMLGSGKADRKAVAGLLRSWWTGTKRPGAAIGADPLAAAWWAMLPGRPEEAGDSAGFLTLGGHSLLAARLVGWIGDHLGVEVPLSLLLADNGSLDDVRAAVRAAQRVRLAAPAGAPAPAGAVPLTPAQRGIWLLSRLHGARAAAYNVVGALRLRGGVRVSALEAAVNDLPLRHQALRLRVVEDADGTPSLEEVADRRLPLRVEDADEALTPDAVAEFVGRVGAVPLPVDTAPLAAVSLLRGRRSGEACLAVVLHHLVADQRSLELVLADIAAGYSAEVGGRPRPAPRADGAFLDHVAEVGGTAGSARWKEDLRYWEELLADAPPESVLPFRGRGEQPPGYAGRSTSLELDAARTAELDAFCRAHAVTPFIVFATCLAIVLRGWLGRDSMVLGMPVSQRRSARDDRTVGLLLETVPLRIDAAPDLDAGAFLRHVRERCAAAMTHGAPGFDTILRELGVSTRPTDNPLFQIWLNDLSHAAPAPDFSGIEAEHCRPPGTAALFDVNVYLRREPHYTLEVTTAVDRVPPGVAEHLLDQLDQVLDQLLERPGTPIDRFAFDRPQESGPAAGPAAAADAPGHGEAGVCERFLRTAARFPSVVALSGDGRRISYAALRRRVERVAAELTRHGVGAGDPVVLHARRHPGLAEALLGVMTLGAAPVVLDADSPAALLAEQRGVADPVAEVEVRADGEVEVARVESAGRSGRTLPERGHVLFTSGTGGGAAAVVVPHAALCANLAWYQEFFRPAAGDRTALVGGLGHDPVLRDLLVPLCAGGTVAVPTPETLTSPTRLFDFLERERVTLLHATPALLEVVAAGHEERPGRELSALRAVVSGGAPLTAGLARRVRRFTRARLVNAYGATETPQIASCQVIAEFGAPVDPTWPDETVLPFGAGVNGAELLVVDEHGARCPVGRRGEIVVRSRHLALGYLGPDRSAEAFAVVEGHPGVREFRTGDLGRLDPWGGIRLEGRRDRQVLVNGYRVNLEHVEAAAVRHHRVRRARAAMCETAVGDALKLLVVPAGPRPSPTGDEIRAHLRTVLPRYAVPAVVDVVTDLDTDRNHKTVALERRTEEPAATPARPAAPAPGSRSDARLAELRTISAQALGWPLDADTNFFDAGLDSITLLRFHEVLVRKLGRRFAVTTLFVHSNLRSLAAFLGEERAPSPGAEQAGEVGSTAPGAADRRRAIRAALHGEAAESERHRG